MMLGALAVLGACSAPTSGDRQVRPQGPPQIRPAVVERHATQFRSHVPARPAGSQEEEIAATYMLGHLQRAGYVVFLDAVPVADLVQSTNVMALPPGGNQPEVVVVVPYDTVAQGADYSVGLGLFLELARAQTAADTDHAFEFVALGAQQTRLNGGSLGARRLAQYLRDREQGPVVVSLTGIATTGEVSIGGPAADEIVAAGGVGAASERASGDPVASVFERAGFETASVSGGAETAGEALLAWFES